MLRLDLNFVFTIINLIVLYLLMKHFLIGPVRSIMEKRASLIEGQLKNASDTEAKANDLKGQYEEKLQSSYDEAAKIVAEAKTEAKAEYDRVVAEAGIKAAKIIEDAQKAAAMEQEKMLREAESQIAVLVMAATAKVIGENSSEQSNQSIYDQFLAKAGDSHDTNLG